MIAFIWEIILFIKDKIKPKKEEQIQIEQVLYKRKAEEMTENIAQKNNEKKQLINNKNVKNNKIEEEQKVKIHEQIKLNKVSSTEIHNKDLKILQEKVRKGDIKNTEIKIQKQNKNQMEESIKESEAKKEIKNKEEKSKSYSKNKIIIGNNNDNLKLKENFKIEKISINNSGEKNKINKKEIEEGKLNNNNKEEEKKSSAQNDRININLEIRNNFNEKFINNNADLAKLLSILNDVKFTVLNLKIDLSYLATIISDKIISENVNRILNKIKSKIIKISNIFSFLNNIRLILFSRKYINKIIQNEVQNNSNIRISKKLYLNDFIGAKYINDDNKLKLYVSQFIVQIGPGKLSQKIYNLVLDFFYYLKSKFNDSVHIVKTSEDITSNKLYDSIFYDTNSNFEIIDDNINKENNNNQNTNQKEEYNENINIITNESLNNTNIKIEDIKNINANLTSINNIIKNIQNKFSNEELESKLVKAFSINNEKEEITNYSNFALHDLENDSINNFKKIFIHFFYKDDLNNIDKKNPKSILDNEMKEITKEYSKINELLKKSESLLNKLIDSFHLSKNKNSDLVMKIISEATIIQENINKMKKLNNDIEKNASKYYELFLLSTAYKVKAKDLEEKIKNDKNVLTFENIFEEWKKSFDENYIIGLKEKYDINKDNNFIVVPNSSKLFNKFKYNDDNKIEYLKTSGLYNAFIDKNELCKMNSKDMINYIDSITKGITIDIFGTDEEINYNRLNYLEESDYMKSK